ncbi:molybdate ABC transporter substrate-binding protein [Sagittula salina]|uniref:Molybdate-binding protein ModA n=1 Tax=Sagittula salina TaxID=2820268 RepID=A0A940MRW2_9RHOB|nr:molybdate ABC transporter substrate-binding protein [Sagittula salina]MBP0484269.1 molybdate ABC transporter substrate-binding protein [Sagittula salina]
MIRFLACLFAVFLAPPLWARDVTVFAAASLGTALEEIARAYEAETGDHVTASYAGSSVLARQIEQGAPADVFLSANTDWMDALEGGGLLAPGTRRDLLGNALVLVSAEPGTPVTLTAQTDLPALLAGGKLAMALVDSVPAGIYGKAALTSLGLWSGVAPSVAQSDNVRSTLALVATGAAPFGIVYATDAQAEPRVHARATFPDDSHPPITYPAAALTGHEQAGLPFLTFLATPQARAMFERNGFRVLAE